MANAECLVICIAASKYAAVFAFLAVFSLAAAAGCLISRDGFSKVGFYWFLNAFFLLSILVVYLSMSCSMSWLLKAYIGYVAAAAAVLSLVPRVYRAYLAKRYGVERFYEMEDFLKRISGYEKSRLFILHSSLPKAFTMGRDVFVSAGMIELLSRDELIAVIAHEAFHVKQNRYPLVRNLQILTFIPAVGFEKYADMFAEGIVGKDALERAKKKLSEFYRSSF